MVRNFRGQVRVEDVQNEFDDLTTKMNNLIDEYNNTDKVKEIDYSVGGPSLSNSGYSLTVGGLKQFLALFNNTIIGCKPFKLNSSTFITTPGLYIHSKGITKIPSATLNAANASSLWYNITKKELNCPKQITTTTTTYSVPKFTSNNTYGTVYSNYNSSKAYHALLQSSTSGWIGTKDNVTSSNLMPNTWTWNLPSPGLKVTSGSITWSVVLNNNGKQQLRGSMLCEVYVNGTKRTITATQKTSYPGTIAPFINFKVDIPSNITINSIQIKLGSVILSYGSNWKQLWGLTDPNICNLKINGATTTTTTVIGEGEGVGIKICDLKWRSNSLAMEYTSNLRLDK